MSPRQTFIPHTCAHCRTRLEPRPGEIPSAYNKRKTCKRSCGAAVANRAQWITTHYAREIEMLPRAIEMRLAGAKLTDIADATGWHMLTVRKKLAEAGIKRPEQPAKELPMKTCCGCLKAFTPKLKKRRYCSVACAAHARAWIATSQEIEKITRLRDDGWSLQMMADAIGWTKRTIRRLVDNLPPPTKEVQKKRRNMAIKRKAAAQPPRMILRRSRVNVVISTRPRETDEAAIASFLAQRGVTQCPTRYAVTSSQYGN